MEFRVLGPLEVTDGDRTLPLGGPKQRIVLAHLLLQSNRVLTTDRLIDAVWGDEPPESARNTLQTYIKLLRKLVGAERIQHVSSGYLLPVDDRELDLLRFESLVDAAHRAASTDLPGASQRLREALGLWRGPALADLAQHASLRPEISRLEEMRVAAIEDRIAAELALGRHHDLIAELETLIGHHPYRERSWGHLMTALYRSGRQGDALAAYQRAREILGDELGIDPSPELRSLQEQILRQDAALELGGRSVRGFRLLEQLGEGAFGVVHRAFQPEVGREVAVKIVHPRLANDPEFIRRFDAEAQLVARLEHPRIVPVHDYWRDPAGAYLVMRYLRGGNLRQAVAGGPLDLDVTAKVIDQVAQALAAAHRQGVIHRDVQPANILFDEDGNTYLSDFGIARDLAMSQAGTESGTDAFAYYLSPEEARGETPTHRADIYSLGLVLYECLTGSRSLDGSDEDHEPVSSLRPDLPSGLDQVIGRAIATDPFDRYPDAPALATAFHHALTGTGPAEADAAVGQRRNPYKGLRSFAEADTADFFGREASIDELLARMKEDHPGSRFLAVVGPSGSGKSSLIRAGLTPALRRGGLPGSEAWFFIDMLPGAHPFEELGAALTRIAVDPPDDLAERLEHDDEGLLQIATHLLPDDGAELVLLVDQFEELFTLVDDEGTRTRFLDAIIATTTPGSRIRVVVTLRADFYDRPLLYKRFGELVATHTYPVTPLSASELEEAICGPAVAVGVTVGAGLVGEIVAEVTDRPGALPLAQYALTELFEGRDDDVLTVETYRALGGVSGALARRAQDLYGRLGPAGEEAARQLFLRLVEVGEGGADDTRRRLLRSELTSLDVDPDAMEAAIDAFGARRLLSFDRDPETRGPTVEVAHETLLREWGRLRGWIESAREDLKTERRLGAATADWEREGRDPSFLLRGAHLEQLAAWAGSSALALSRNEGVFLEASLELAETERGAEQERRERERALERRSVRRLRTLVAVLVVAVLVASGLTIVATHQSERAEAEARIATARELAAASVANLEADPEQSILLAMEAIDRTRSVDGSVLPEAEEALHRAVVASRLVMSVPGIGGLLDWSAAPGRAQGVFVTEGPEDTGVIDIRDGETGESVLSFEGHDGDINDVAFSPDGSKLATAGDDGWLRVWDPSTGRLLSRLSAGGSVWGPSFSADGSLVAAAWGDSFGDDARVRVLDVSTDREILAVPVQGAIDTALDPDGTHVAVVSFWGGFAVLEVETGDVAFGQIRPQCCPDPGSRGVSWSLDGRYIATTNEDSARVWDAGTGRLRYTLRGHTGFVLGVDWSPDSARLATGGSDGTAKVWEIRAKGVRALWSLSSQETRSGTVGVAFSPDGTQLMAGDAGITAVQVWDLGLDGDAEWANIPETGAPDVDFMPDGRRVVGSRGRALTVWDSETGRELRTIGPATDRFWFSAFDVDPDGGSIALGGGENPDHYGGQATRVWDAATGEELYRLWHRLDVNDVAFSADGEHLVTASWDGEARIVDRTGHVVRVLREDTFALSSARFSPDGRLVATAAYRFRRAVGKGHVNIWDWEGDEVVRTISADALGMDFDPTGSRIALASSDGSAAIWDVEAGTRLVELAGHSGGITDIAFSPDGSRVATASFDGTVRLFEAEGGAQRLVLRGHTCGVSSVAFSPDGTKLASASACGIRIWALDIDDLLGIARQKLMGSLSDAECQQYVHLDACPQAR